MRVISLIRRPQGHVVRLDRQEYAFQPPTWACECREPRHLARFQAIPEGYRLEAEPAAGMLELPGLGLVSPGADPVETVTTSVPAGDPIMVKRPRRLRPRQATADLDQSHGQS